jgi:putative membrane protein
MLKKLSALPIYTFFLLSEPLQAIAQQTQPPATPQPPQGYYWPGPWHMWSDGYGWPHWWIGPLMMITFAVICMAMMFFMMRGGMMHRHRGHHALDLLKERFARGEITQAEYEDRRRVLGV